MFFSKKSVYEIEISNLYISTQKHQVQWQRCKCKVIEIINNKQSKSKQVHKFFLWFDLIDFWCRCCTLVDKAKLNVDHRCLNHFSCAKTLQYGFKTDIKIISYSPTPPKKIQNQNSRDIPIRQFIKGIRN